MPFVKRDRKGAIVAVSATADIHCCERIAADDAALIDFIGNLQVDPDALRATDQSFIRVLEDVVAVLIEHKVILFSDLPEDAQDKILLRQNLRKQLGSVRTSLDA